MIARMDGKKRFFKGKEVTQVAGSGTETVDIDLKLLHEYHSFISASRSICFRLLVSHTGPHLRRRHCFQSIWCSRYSALEVLNSGRW